VLGVVAASGLHAPGMEAASVPEDLLFDGEAGAKDEDYINDVASPLPLQAHGGARTGAGDGGGWSLVGGESSLRRPLRGAGATGECGGGSDEAELEEGALRGRRRARGMVCGGAIPLLPAPSSPPRRMEPSSGVRPPSKGARPSGATAAAPWWDRRRIAEPPRCL
jgi:hypothetical protein